MIPLDSIRRSAAFVVAVLLTESAAATIWWVDFRRTPSASVMLGSPVSSFDPSWVAAELLDATETSGLPKDVVDQMRQHRLSFSITTRSLKPGHQESVRVGVYTDSAGQSGAFSIILEDGRALKVLPYPDEPGFSALSDTPDGVDWYFCMKCGTHYRIVYEDGYFIE